MVGNDQHPPGRNNSTCALDKRQLIGDVMDHVRETAAS